MLSESFVSPQKGGNLVDKTIPPKVAPLKVRRGFTLLEILIAMCIFAIVLSILYTAYTGTFRNIDETESQANVYQMARVTLERMGEDLQSTYLSHRASDPDSEEEPLQPNVFRGEATEIDARSADTLRFFSRAHLVFDEENTATGVARIAYEVRQSEVDEQSLVLYRSDTPRFEKGPEEEGGGLVLCDGIQALNLTYYDDKERAYDSWDSTDEEFEGKLPVRVSILLELVNQENPEAPLKFMTGVALPMAEEENENAS